MEVSDVCEFCGTLLTEGCTCASSINRKVIRRRKNSTILGCFVLQNPLRIYEKLQGTDGKIFHTLFRGGVFPGYIYTNITDYKKATEELSQVYSASSAVDAECPSECNCEPYTPDQTCLEPADN